MRRVLALLTVLSIMFVLAFAVASASANTRPTEPSISPPPSRAASDIVEGSYAEPATTQVYSTVDALHRWFAVVDEQVRWYRAAALTDWYAAVQLNEQRQRTQTTPTYHAYSVTVTPYTADAIGHTPCAIPAYICQRESRYDIHAQNPVSSASGKYQFLDSTWANFGGYQHAKDAPEWMQDERARQVWAATGGSAWACC